MTQQESTNFAKAYGRAVRRKVRNDIFELVNKEHPELHWRERFKIARELSKWGPIYCSSGNMNKVYGGHFI